MENLTAGEESFDHNIGAGYLGGGADGLHFSDPEVARLTCAFDEYRLPGHRTCHAVGATEEAKGDDSLRAAEGSLPASGAYVEAFMGGQQVELSPGSPLRGRILRGQEEADFEILGSPERSIVFIMGPDGLSALPGIEPLAALDRIGLTPGYVQGRIAQGHRFRLLVFEGGEAAPLATWDNALDMVARTHPELSEDIEMHRAALKTTPFEAFQADVAEPLDDIELAGPMHRDYMSLERYLALSAEERANPAKLRRLLFHTEHLGTLFSGDGYTRTPDGEIGLAEYLVPNGLTTDLPDAKIIDLL